jgi:sec-independent protein translocase protein TatC
MAKPRDENELEAGRMPFFEHLRELRDRLRNAIICFLAGFAVAYFFKEQIFGILMRPLVRIWQAQAVSNKVLQAPEIYFGSLTEPFWVYMSLSLWAGVFIASPLIFLQVWKFVAPGLYKKERNFGILFAVASGISFIGGAVFCYHFVLERMYGFLLSYASSNVGEMSKTLGLDASVNSAIALKPHLFMREYLDLARGMMLGFGLVFELPLLIFFLATIGLVTHKSLWKFNRYWIVISFIVGAVLTPSPDIGSQIAMSVPLVVLYEISIGIAYLVGRKKKRDQEALARANPPAADDEEEDDD